MENKDTPRQEEAVVRCTIDEFLTMMEPVFRQQKIIVEKCIAGLTVYAANLAAKRQEDDIPGLTRFVEGMAFFWEPETSEARAAAFEQAVSEARNSGQAPTLTGENKADILAGLALYAQEMRCVDLEMEECAVECENLAVCLQGQWQAAQRNETAEGMTIGGMT